MNNRITLENRLVSDNLYELLNIPIDHISVSYGSNPKIIIKQDDGILSYPYWSDESAESDFNELIRIITRIQNIL